LEAEGQEGQGTGLDYQLSGLDPRFNISG